MERKAPPHGSTPPVAPAAHFPTPAARRADLLVHLVALAAAVIGALVLVRLSLNSGDSGQVVAIAIYAAALVIMLSFSAAYNFSHPPYQAPLRRLDHAGIFLMIAGTYTPFTTQVLSGGWAWGMTLAIWSLAGLGILAKLLLPGLDRRVSVGLYIALSSIVLAAIGPVTLALGTTPLLLLVGGGVIYIAGTAFYLNKRLRYGRAIWHGHVATAAALHWTAILLGVVWTGSIV
ncbi:MAG: hemolysin III [Rhizobiales bacterium 32-66-8]|nr:MAG: hemolysin III [Rhizobiales bacterium 32-66-8]